MLSVQWMMHEKYHSVMVSDKIKELKYLAFSSFLTKE